MPLLNLGRLFQRYALWRALGFVISVICVLRTYEGLGNGSFAAFGPEDVSFETI